MAKKVSMSKLRAASVSLLVAMLLLLSFPHGVAEAAEAGPPHRFLGAAYMNNVTVDAGTQVSVWSGDTGAFYMSTSTGSITGEQPYQYLIDVPGTYDGEPLVFKVAAVTAKTYDTGGNEIVTVTFQSGGYDAVNLKAETPPDSLIFLTSPRSMNAGQPSAVMTVQHLDENGTPTPVAINTVLNLLSSSTQGSFSLAATSWNPVTSVTMLSGHDSASFYYKDTRAGTPTITVAKAGWLSATQQETINPLSATQLAVTGITDPIAAGNASTVIVTARDAYGNTAPSYTGTIYFTSSDAQATQPVNYTFQVGDHGVKTFSGGVTLKTVGEQWVKATDTVTPSITGQQAAITVTAAAAFRLEVTAAGSSSATMTAGTTKELTITAKDQYGNIATGYIGTKSLTFSGPGTAPDGTHYPTVETKTVGAATTVSFTAGVSAANAATLTAYKAETTTVNVSDGTYNSSGGYGLALTVYGAAAIQLVVTGITDPVVVGTASSVIVTAKDTYGNIANTYTGTIHFTSSDVQATLPGNYTFQPSDNGVKTFSGTVTLKTVGEQWVKATDIVTATITGQQTAITVTAAAASRLEVTGSASMTAGGASELTIRAKDQYGNIVTSYSGAKNLTFSGPGTAPGGQQPKVENVVIGNLTTVNFTNGVSSAGAATLVAYRAEITTVDVSDGTISSSGGYGLNLTVNAAAISRLAFVTTAQTITAGQPSAVMTVQSQDANGNPVNVSSSSLLTLSSSSTSAQKAFSLNPTTWVNITSVTIPIGQNSASFYYKDALAGTPTITVAKSGWTSATQQETINPLSASQLVVAGITDPVAAGTPSGVTVTARDAYGNTATNYTGTIHFTSSDAPATLPGNYTFQAGDNGVKTFSGEVIMKTVGERSVTATDTVTATITGQQTAITVTAAAASRLEVTAAGSSSATMTAGTTKELTITAKDQYGNIATGYSGTKSLTFSGPGVAPGGTQPTVETKTVGTVTSVTFTGGVSAANAATLMACKAEDTTVDVSDGAISSSGDPAYDLDLTVNAAAASRLEVTGSTSMVAGNTNELTITARDQYGNVAIGYSATKSLTFSGPGVAPGGQQPTVKGTIVGSPTSVSFTNGVSNAGAALVAYKVEATTVDVSDGSLNSSASPAYDLDLTVTPATASQLVVAGITDPVVAGTASSVIVTAKDAYGNIATNYTGTIHFTSSDAQATWPGNYPFQAGDNGVKTFSGGVTMKTAGEQWVRATDTVSAIFGQQTAITVTPAAASRLEVTGSTSMVAGNTNELTITARDQYGNVATGYSATKSLTFSGPGVAPGGQQPTVKGTIVGSSTSVPFTSGVSNSGAATLVAYKVEATTVDVSDGSLNSSANPAYDLDLTVTPATASQLVVAGITDPVVAGTACGVTVTAKDAYGNIATNYTGTIHFTSSDAQATWPGSYTFQVGDHGVKTFSGGVTMKTVGEQWVKATDTVTATITGEQTAITVTPAAAFRLEVTGNTSMTAGGTNELTIRAKDQYGNLVTSYSGPKNLTFSGPGTAPDGTHYPTVKVTAIGNPTSVTFTNGVSNTNAATLTAYKAEATTVNVSDGSINSSGYGLALTVNATAISQLVFTTPSRNIAVSGASAVMTVQTQDAYDNPANVSSSSPLTLSSTSATGWFSLNATPWVNITSVTIPGGQNSASFYYKDTTIGTPLITAAETPSQGWTDASQQQAVSPVAIVGQIDLQGRPPKGDESWVTNLTVTFLQGGVAVSTQNVTTDNQGRFTVAITTGTYDIRVKSARTLSNLVIGQAIVPGTNPVYFGTLREGDANGDNAVTGADYAVLWTYFGATSAPGLGYCDFNRDGMVRGLDYALLWMNFGQIGQ